MDRGARWATVYEATRVRHDLATKQESFFSAPPSVSPYRQLHTLCVSEVTLSLRSAGLLSHQRTSEPCSFARGHLEISSFLSPFFPVLNIY